MKTPILYLIIPCFNEEEMLDYTYPKTRDKISDLIKRKSIHKNSKIVFIDDGSKDQTWKKIEKIHKKDSLVRGISLSKNWGHQNALLSGLSMAKEEADIAITMDADLQDDIDAIDEMIEKYKEGSDIVYGVRSSRKKDSFFKRKTAEAFYKFMKLLGVDCIYNHADYRLTSKRVLKELENYKEVNLFLRGLFPLMGYHTSIVYYERGKRIKGKTKYSLRKMCHFALEGITSFSVQPLRIIFYLGFLILCISIGIMIYSLIRKINGNTVPGWTFLSISIWFIGGLQMISIGGLGEYIGKLYKETKQRPRYIIDKKL